MMKQNSSGIPCIRVLVERTTNQQPRKHILIQNSSGIPCIRVLVERTTNQQPRKHILILGHENYEATVGDGAGLYLGPWCNNPLGDDVNI
uniref:Uncharacterized protein n=1 Tax=Tanacetum cinerariifolium TaxID=118510 RepID=A0A699KDB5_TANCI|nr:hypothetical protein [Tanacetum cinerariifolium]